MQISAFLIDDGVDDHGGLAGLAVTNDQFALAAADRDQRIDRLQPGLHRLVHRLARNDSGRLYLHAAAFGVHHRALAVDRVAQTVDHAAEQTGADWYLDDGAGSRDGVAFTNLLVVAEYNDADIVGLQIQRHPAQAGARELNHFARHHILQAEYTGDTVTHRQDLTRFSDIGFGIERGDLLLQDLRDLGWTDLHSRRLPS
jgi:hypothetical protein